MSLSMNNMQQYMQLFLKMIVCALSISLRVISKMLTRKGHEYVARMHKTLFNEWLSAHFIAYKFDKSHEDVWLSEVKQFRNL